jgi:hypothetical protein
LAYQIAEIYAWRGEKDKAFEWIHIAFDNHDTGMLSLLIDPLMHGLHHDARYDGLPAKIGLGVAIVTTIRSKAGSSQMSLPRMRENQIPLSGHGGAIDRPVVFDCNHDSDRNHLRPDRFAVRFRVELA